MNGPLTERVQDVVYVEVLRSVQLDRLAGSTVEPRHAWLETGSYECLIVKIGESDEEWVLFSHQKDFGKKLTLLRGLEKAQSVEVTDKEGRPYFNG